jgi:large repetitive protein
VRLTVSDGFLTDSCSASVRVRDCEPPSITCGPPVQAECTGNESAFVSAGGADAMDACSAVDVSGPGLTSYPLGSTSVTYTATDAAGNTAACTTRVQVRDTLPPSTTCPAPTVAECVDGGASNSGVGTASAVDVCSPVAVQGPGLASFPLGTASLTWSASDTSGNTASCSAAFTVADTQPPSLTLNGPNPLPLECMRDWYSEPGATALDACSGNISGAISIEHGYIDSARLGTYPVTYRVADSGGNVATAMREVHVQDTLPPELYLNGAARVTLECKVSTFSDPGATAQDVCSGNLTGAITVSGAVNPDAPGAYPLHYRVQDARGLVTEKVRDVRVVDTLPPTITLEGSSTPVMECSREGIIALGATASDVCAGDISHRITVTGTEHIVAPGTYPITYNVTDPSGNAAVGVTRSVTVRDTKAPVVTIRGEANMTLECGVDTYTELGATAYDACQGDMTSQVNTYGNGANAAAVGTYSIQYGVWDASGNTTMALRTVKVVDRLPPTLSLVGASTVQHECASGPYVDQGATASDACYGDLTRSVTTTGAVNAWARGNYTLTYNVQDSTLLKATPRTRTVQVVDTQAPTIEYRDVTLLPADHTLRSLSLADCVTAGDTCDGYALANNGTILSIYSDEPEDVPGSSDGHTLEDIVITGKSTFKVRAERQREGDGRVYGVAFELKDQTGNVRSGLCRIRVPANDASVASDSGASSGYTVVAPPPAPLASRTAR